MTASSDSPATTTFRKAYGVLQKHAETLRNQDEPNIDDLLTIVTESVDAYKVCQERIDAVEKALEKALSETAAPVKEPRGMAKSSSTPIQPTPPTRSPIQAAPFAESDDGDIPF